MQRLKINSFAGLAGYWRDRSDKFTLAMSAIPQRLLEISSWPSDVQSLRLTPKEIEQTIKRERRRWSP